MGILKRINRHLRVKQKVVEISSDDGLMGTYALRRARGEGEGAGPEVGSTTGSQRPEAEREAGNGRSW